MKKELEGRECGRNEEKKRPRDTKRKNTPHFMVGTKALARHEEQTDNEVHVGRQWKLVKQITQDPQDQAQTTQPSPFAPLHLGMPEHPNTLN